MERPDGFTRRAWIQNLSILYCSNGSHPGYVQFRKFLLNDGYDMIQWSVYGRILNGIDAEKKHLARLAEHLPPEGSVRSMTVTEKQYAGMRLLVVMPLFQEKKVASGANAAVLMRYLLKYLRAWCMTRTTRMTLPVSR